MSSLTASLPIKLSQEPLIDAIFELRFAEGVYPLSTLLPGYFLQKYLNLNLSRLPASEIPVAFRNSDPNLKYAVLVRMEDDFFIYQIGDYTISICSKIPYAGWAKFKPRIIEILTDLAAFPPLADSAIERYSMKYVNLIEAGTPDEQVSALDMKLEISAFQLANQNFHIRLEKNDNGFVHIISLISGAVALVNGSQKMGVIVDIDTLKSVAGNVNLGSLLTNFESDIEAIHSKSKREFFACLKDETIKKMGPAYAQ